LLKHPDASFAFEAGFLAQEIQQLTNCGAEAQWEAGKNSVTITVITEESIENARLISKSKKESETKVVYAIKLSC
jgi:Protein of unknown function (DUF2507).